MRIDGGVALGISRLANASEFRDAGVREEPLVRPRTKVGVGPLFRTTDGPTQTFVASTLALRPRR
jgi:hypothetical protein